MAGQAPPPSYDEVVKSNPPPGGWIPQGPPVTSATAPYPPAGYSPGMPPAYPPPPVQGALGTQPPAEGGYPHFTYSTVNAGPIAPGGGHHYQFPGNQGGPAYQQSNVTVSTGNFQTGTPSLVTQKRRAKIGICIVLSVLIFIIVVIIIVI